MQTRREFRFFRVGVLENHVLMDSETAAGFLQTLNLPDGKDINLIERRFLDLVKDHIYAVAESYDEEQVAREEDWLAEFHNSFFQYAGQWITEQMLARGDEAEHPEALKLVTTARGAIEALQKNIIAFSQCYMHINRFMTLLRDEIRREEIKVGAIPKNVKWTSDAGVIIARHKKRKKQIIEDNRRMRESRDLLEKIEGDMMVLRKSISTLYGKETGETYARRIISSLRTSDFKKARKAVQDLLSTKAKFSLDLKGSNEAHKNLEETATRLIDTISAQVKVLQGHDNKLYLRPIETDMAFNAQVQELRKIKSFLAKYHLPYMQYKLDSLFHLKDKLLVVGSLESLLTLYKRLIMGIVGPLKTIRDVRLYEHEVLDHISWLLNGQFQEVPKILERARETVSEFRESRKEYEELEKMSLQEVAIDQNQASAANV